MAVNLAFEKYTLSNGLDVILHEDHAIPVVSVNIWYHVGSQNEEPDRTGFAHLFEHIMFKGSKHHKREYFTPLQEVGANVNGSTTTDRTNYYENVPAEYLELALWLESDRMGFLLDALDQTSFDVEREVVKNERRQSYENRPYGMASIEIRKALFPPNHPYHWQTIGSQEHLDAASVDDVKAFFRRFYAPNNASLSIAGDIDVEATKAMVDKYFGDLVPAASVPRVQRWMPQLDDEVRVTLDDRVQLPRIYFSWVGPPRFDEDEAALDVLLSILGQGHSARLYRSLVYEKQIAREVGSHYSAMEIAGEIRMEATIAPGASLADVETGMLAEIDAIKATPPSADEVQRAINRIEASHIRQTESIGGFGGRANMLNFYNVFSGDPGRVNTDLDRFMHVTPEDVSRVGRAYLGNRRVRLVVSPKANVAPAPIEVDRTQQPGTGRARSFEVPVPVRISLAGGMELLVVEKHDVPTLGAAIFIPGGALTDPSDAPGLTSMMTRLLSEGTTTKSSTQIADESEFIAARLSLNVHRESVIASTELLTRHWPRALALLSDVTLNPTFPEREVDRIRRERLTDLRRLRDDANAISERVSNGVLYGRDTKHGHPLSGREQAVAAMTRDQLGAHHRSAFLGGRPTFLVVGDVDRDAIARDLEKAISAWPARTQDSVTTETDRDAPPTDLVSQTTIFLVDKPGAAQSVISAGHLSVSRLHPDFLPLTVMNMAFGGQYTARLNMNLREDKGYTYGYRSRLDWRLASSVFSAGGSVQTAVTKEALVETLKEFRDLRSDRPIAQEEFEKAQLGLIRGYPPTFETAGQILGRLVDLVHYGLPDDYYLGQIERLAAVTLPDVRRVADEHIRPEALSIVIVGDRTVVEPRLEELGLPIVHLDTEGAPV